MSVQKPISQMGYQDVLELIAQSNSQESFFLEFKVINFFLIKQKLNFCKEHQKDDECDYYKSRDEIPLDVAQFLNANGGLIIYSVDDSGNIAGLSKTNFSDPAKIEDELTIKLNSFLKSSISPANNLVQYKSVEIPDRSDRFLFLVNVQEGSQKWYAAKYHEHWVHMIRNEKTKAPMDRETIKWGYIEQSVISKEIDAFLKSCIKPTENGYLNVVAIPKNFRNEWVELEKRRLDCLYRIITNELELNRLYSQNLISDFFELNTWNIHFRRHTADKLKHIIMHDNGCIECKIFLDSEDSRDNLLEFNFLMGIDYIKKVSLEPQEYIITIILDLTEDTINRYFSATDQILKGLYYSFRRPIVNLKNVEIKMGITDKTFYPELEILLTQLARLQNIS
jgi:hypothetical protein